MPPKPRPFWSQVDKSAECWIWIAGKDAGGYGSVRFRGRMRKAHRVAWILTHGEIQEGLCVLHRCDNPPCVRPEHLFLGTLLDNNRDRHTKGRTKTQFSTMLNPRRKLSDEDRLEIVRLRQSGVRRAVVAQMFGVSESTVKKTPAIVRRRPAAAIQNLLEQLNDDG